MTRRGAAAAAAGVLGAAVLSTSWPAWLRVPVSTAIDADVVAVAGSAAVPAVPAAGLVLLAAAPATALGGRVTRVLAAAGAVAAGAAIVLATTAFLAEPGPAAQAAAAARTGVRGLEAQAAVTAWPVVAVVLGALAAGTGLLLLVLAPREGRAARDRRYERAPARDPSVAAERSSAGASTTDERTRALADWDALSRGEDPS